MGADRSVYNVVVVVYNATFIVVVLDVATIIVVIVPVMIFIAAIVFVSPIFHFLLPLRPKLSPQFFLQLLRILHFFKRQLTRHTQKLSVSTR